MLIPSFLILYRIFLGVLNLESLLFCLRYAIVFLVGRIGLALETLELGRGFLILDRVGLIIIFIRLLVVLRRVWASELEFNAGRDWLNLMACFQFTAIVCLVAFRSVGLFRFFIVYEIRVIPIMGLILL